MEYLATYGWAVLIVVVIGAVIWQSGVLSIGKNVTPGKSGFSQVRPYDWVVIKDGVTADVNISVMNDAGTKVSLTGASADECSGGAASGDLLPGGSTIVELTGCNLPGKSGDYFRIKATIIYNNIASGISHSSVGEIWGSIE